MWFKWKVLSPLRALLFNQNHAEGETINDLILWFTGRILRYEDMFNCVTLKAKGN